MPCSIKKTFTKGVIERIRADAFKDANAVSAGDENGSVAKPGSDGTQPDNPAKQAADYLNQIISGEIDGMADGVLDRMIGLAEPFEDDPEIAQLIDRANAAIEAAMPKDI